MDDQEIRAKALEINTIWCVGIINSRSIRGVDYNVDLLDEENLHKFETYIRSGKIT